MKKVLVLGATGMLGSTCYSVISESSSLATEGTSRTLDGKLLHLGAEDLNQASTLIAKVQPDYVVNCIGIIK